MLTGACTSTTDSSKGTVPFSYTAEVDTFPAATMQPDSASWHLVLSLGQRELTIYTVDHNSTIPLTRPVELILRLQGAAVAGPLTIPGTYFPPGGPAATSFVAGALATDDFVGLPIDGSLTIASVDSFHIRGSFDLTYQTSSATPAFNNLVAHVRGAYTLGAPEYISH